MPLSAKGLDPFGGVGRAFTHGRRKFMRKLSLPRFDHAQKPLANGKRRTGPTLKQSANFGYTVVKLLFRQCLVDNPPFNGPGSCNRLAKQYKLSRPAGADQVGESLASHPAWNRTYGRFWKSEH